jgi:hypothetical protein
MPLKNSLEDTAALAGELNTEAIKRSLDDDQWVLGGWVISAL